MLKWSFIASMATFLFLLTSASHAVPVSFSFTNYSGPASTIIKDTKDGKVTDTVEGNNYYVGGKQIQDDNSIDQELVHQIEYDYEGHHYTTDVYNSFGEVDIYSDAQPLYFGNTAESQSNMFSFDPAEETEEAIGVDVYLGTFTFRNDSWFLADSFFEFTITATSKTAGKEDQTFTGAINLITNPNDLGTPEARADWFWIEGRKDLGSVRVYDEDDGSNTGSVEFWGEFGSLDLIELRNPTGGAFLSPSTTENPAPIPEPATGALLGIGLLGLVELGRKKFFKKN